MLELYRSALLLRRSIPALGDGSLRWLDAPEQVLHFVRSPGFACLVNLSASSVPAPVGRVRLSSSSVGELVPPDTAVWVTSDD
jgi:alpha-glucosidase